LLIELSSGEFGEPGKENLLLFQRGSDSPATRLWYHYLMNSEQPIAFTETSQTFVCDQYYADNFRAFLQARSLSVQSPEEGEPKSITGEKRLLLRIAKGSQHLKQEQGNALISQFLAADAEIKSQKR
jgi:hypothetical protein